MNIPIYRAKRIDNGEWVEGFLLVHNDEYFIVHEGAEMFVLLDGNGISDENEIDPSTLAIHFPDMTDVYEEKIFAALSDSGVGGSTEEFDGNKWVWFMSEGRYVCREWPDFLIDTEEIFENVRVEKITGIYEG